MSTVYMKQGDLLPVLRAKLRDSTGTPLNLTGATVKFRMRREASPGPVVDAAAAVVGSPVDGDVEYTWAAADVAKAGKFIGDFLVTYLNGSMSVPSNGFISVVVNPALL